MPWVIKLLVADEVYTDRQEFLDFFTTKRKILYLSTLEPEERISLARIQERLEREGKPVSLDKIRDVLVKLSRGDLLEYLELGGWFRKIDDPILLEFPKVGGRIEVEGQDANRIQDDLVHHYRQLQQRVYELTYLGLRELPTL